MQLLNTLILIFLAAWWTVSFTPIQGIMNLLVMSTKNKPEINFILSLLHTILSCGKCSAFFIGLAISGDIYTALIASFITNLYFKYI